MSVISALYNNLPTIIVVIVGFIRNEVKNEHRFTKLETEVNNIYAHMERRKTQ